MQYEIREASPSDGELIASYNSLMAEETEGRLLHPEVIAAGVSQLLADAGKGRYWVAEANGEVPVDVVGQIMVTYEWSDWRNGAFWWIQSVYVRPDYRRQGVFSALYRHVESVARDNNACGLRLYVENNNVGAQKTYETFGMANPNYQVMEAIFGDSKC